MDYQITYATTRYGGLDIETVDYRDERDARCAFASLREVSHVISATLCDPDDCVIDEFDRG